MASAHHQLVQAIEQLKLQKQHDEALLKQRSIQILLTIHPLSVLLHLLSPSDAAQQEPANLVKSGVRLGANWLIETIFSKHHSLKEWVQMAFQRG